MRRSYLRSLVLSSCAAAAFLGAGAGCSDLRLADLPAEGGTTQPGDGEGDGGPGPATGDGSAGHDAPGPKGPLDYDDVQGALQAKRFPGPTTTQGSKGYCTSKYFVWRETDGTIHSWAAKTQARLDYTWKAAGQRSYFVPADSYIAVDVLPAYANLDVYRTDTANTLVTSIPYAFDFVSANDGVIRLDQSIGGTDLGGTKVRRWNAASNTTEDLTAVLPTREPPSSFVNEVLVIPGGITIPYPLYLVDVAKKTTGSVTFNGGIALQQTEEGAGGDLIVAYVRNGASGAALRVYKKNQDDAASRFELGDELDNRADYFTDAPKLEHKFLTRVATWKQKVLYGSAYGIWSYDLVSGALAPVQLVSGKTAAVPDVMCILKDSNTLVYRMNGDAVGQIWAVPLL